MPIAVVGMACRFPGDGEDVESLFEMLQKGDSAWSEFPADRVNIDGFYHPSGSRQGSIGFKGAHFLKGNIKAFDASFFNISQTEAQAIDPQQRLLLEVTYQALENAGYSKESLDLSETSVNVGTFVKDYEQVVLRDSDWAPQYAATGTGNAILANRISYQFNLRGPSQTVDTGCSASLVGVHNGCQDLRTGRADLAIAAGVGMILTPATMMPMTALNFLGKDGKCYTFTNKAEGYGRGEGVGVVVLKRLDDALRDNDTIRAVIRGSRVNQDGKTPGITMPSAAAQLSNIKAVYKEAGLAVDQTAFVECHGTGTPAGDPKETFAVSKAFCSNRDADDPIYVGSIKPNVGHLEGAAGVAGLIKAVMAVERGKIPKNLYFDPSISNPEIHFEEWKVKVPTKLTSWPKDGLRRASVNCFGFGGTNAHIILDDAGTYLSQRALPGNHRSVPTTEGSSTVNRKQKTFASTQLCLISSHEKNGIAKITEGHAPFIASHAEDASILADYAYTLSRRSTLEYRTFVVAQSAQRLAARLSDPEAYKIQRFAADNTGKPKFAMVFCGQGAQWHAMGRELMEFEPFCNSLVGASKYLSKIVGSDFDLLRELQQDDPALSRIHEPKFAQPATTAVQVALVDLLRASKICPEAVVGHSSGEIAAAYAAGYLAREDAWLIAFRRGQYANSIVHRHTAIKGQMIAVGLSAAEARKYVKAVAPGSVVIACENSPASVTLSGDEEQILHIADMLAADHVWYTVLAVTTAYHSHHMRLVEEEYKQSLQGITPLTSNQGPKMFSSVTGEIVDGALLDASYWSANLVSPVLYNQAFSAMYKAVKPKFVIEVSPSVTLNRPIREIVSAIDSRKSKEFCCIPLLKYNHQASVTMLEALGEIWSRGVPLELSWVWKSKEGFLPQVLVDLPPYPFNHSKSYWFESHLGTALRFRKHGREDLIGAPLVESTPQDPRWRGFFRLEENPWLADHQVQKTIIYPASGLLTMALEAARQCSEPSLSVDAYQISNFNIIKPVIIPAGPHGLEHILNTKVMKVPSPDATHCSTVYSFSIMTRTEYGHWQENAEGLFTIFYSGKATGVPGQAMFHGEDHHGTYQQLSSECTRTINPRQLYERLDGIGLNYGPMFQNIVALSKSQRACTSIVRIPDTKSKMPAQFEYDHLIHPATLDTMFQTVFAIGDSTMVPSYIRQITFSPGMLRGAGAKFHGYATAQLKGFREAQADIVMSDATFSKPMVVVKGMEFVKISSDASSFLPSNRNLCSEMFWHDLGPVPSYTNGTTAVDEGKTGILLLPDGNISAELTLVLRHLALPSLEPVRLSQLSEQHMHQLCISLVEIDQSLLFDMQPQTFSLLKKVLTATSGLLWVTTGAQNAVDNPAKAPFYGLARTIRSEDSSKRIVTLDLGTIQSQGEAALSASASAITWVFKSSFVKPNLDIIPEVEYSLRDRRLFGARLRPLEALNNVIEKGDDEAIQIQKLTLEKIEGPVEVKVGHVTDIKSTYFVTDASVQRPLGANEVRITVDSTHLFPIDLETIMGKSSESVLGADVVGTVTEMGNNVTGLPIGSLVIALARSTIKTSIILNQSFVHKLQDRSSIRGLSPTALVTAYYGLTTVGCISSGDMVFVDRACGPYGDAVLRLSKALGATTFVGVLNAEEKDFIHTNYDIPMDCIIDTTNDRFPDEIMRLTGGAGVELFFSPSPAHLDLSSQCVATNGHLFLIVNANATMLTTAVIPQHANISFHKFDLFALLEKRQKVFSKAWSEVLELQLSGQLGKCPDSLVLEERVEHLDDLWETMSARPGRHLNTVTFTDSSVVRLGTNPLKPVSLDPNATYVLAGGLGGLGKAAAEMMVCRGARYLLFLSRSGAKALKDVDFLESLSQRGVLAKALAVDICHEEALRQALASADMPPIKGAMQCAAVIADAVWEKMTYEEWSATTRPKIVGSWNLHQVLPQDMDFFIFLSSASGVIGNRGQGNYAAGNCYQDALAWHRASKGMHSVSIDLGPVAGAGMLEDDDATCAKLKASGFFMVLLEDYLFLVERAMCGGHGGPLSLPPQVVTGVGTGGLILQNEVSDPYWAETKLFELLNQIDQPQAPSDDSSRGIGRALALALRHADGLDDACEVVLRGCINYLSASLSMSSADMDADKSLTAYGVDSLVTSSFRSWIFKNLGVKITDMEVIGAASIMELARSIAEKGGWGV
ncbi:hypothetical protein M406DRAFT_42237 [Cryphonectria parasitica EP155]|uniref:Polyketide synthase n=1 Tax=Cryphonectria parasitica (strain ATCC 38755 / EP155) TaxID=660469 RepID=A0A9P4Y2E8_CRYP1|nr:uncharacterized protein M406DRAFT_42237 [Cryphonectria parasitica EP155]KAF3765254.1 hypothetical protein M406DRAFT_42237 [Cryphonectria parasitica EP155]